MPYSKLVRHTETLLASCGLALNCTRKRDTAGGCTLPTGTPPDPQPSSVCTPTGDLAICDGRENESRILGTVSNESASVSVAQNDLALPEAWCSSTPAQAPATRDSPFLFLPTVDSSMMSRTSSATKVPFFLAIFSDAAFCGFERKMSVRTYPLLFAYTPR